MDKWELEYCDTYSDCGEDYLTDSEWHDIGESYLADKDLLVTGLVQKKIAYKVIWI